MFWDNLHLRCYDCAPNVCGRLLVSGATGCGPLICGFRRDFCWGKYTDVHYELNFSRQGSLQGAIEGFKTWRLCRWVFFVFNKSSEKNP